MSFLRYLGPASLLVLGGCVAASGDSTSGRAAALADTISRASICGAGSPRASTLERFLAAERPPVPARIRSRRHARPMSAYPKRRWSI